jgi:hypothetical protein
MLCGGKIRAEPSFGFACAQGFAVMHECAQFLIESGLYNCCHYSCCGKDWTAAAIHKCLSNTRITSLLHHSPTSRLSLPPAWPHRYWSFDLLRILILALLEYLKSFLSGFDAAEGHSAGCSVSHSTISHLLRTTKPKSQTHPIRAPPTSHSTPSPNNQLRHNLPSPLNNSILSHIDIQSSHASQLLHLLHTKPSVRH